MTTDPLSFIDEAPAANEPEAPQTPEPASSEAPPATGGPARDEQGRFTAPKEPVAAAAPMAPDPAPQAQTPAPATPAPVEPQEHTVPLAKYLESFHEARELKRENQRLRQEAQTRSSPRPQAPDPIQDPDGYRQHIMDEVKQGWAPELEKSRLAMSEQMARQQFGEEKVNAAFEALEQANDPFAYQRIMQSAHPAGELVKWHQQKQLLDQIGTDPDAYVRRRYAELNPADPSNPNPAAIAQPSPKPALQIPAPSLGRAPAGPSAGMAPMGEGHAFDALFSG